MSRERLDLMTTPKVWISTPISPLVYRFSSVALIGIAVWIFWGPQPPMHLAIPFLLCLGLCMAEALLIHRVSLTGDEVLIEGLDVTRIRLSQVESVYQPRFLRGWHCTLIYRDDLGQQRGVWFYAQERVEVLRERLCVAKIAS